MIVIAMQNENLKEKIDLVTTTEPVDADESTPGLQQNQSSSSVSSSPPAQTNKEIPCFGLRYKDVAVIGHGGMGMVYRATDTITGSPVAIKILNKELIADQTALRRFEQEVASLADLDHDNLVALYGQGHTDDGAPYLVMKFIEGKSLAEILKEETQLTPERAIDLVLQVIEGLAHAHKKGIIHRDLKPSNIMIVKPAQAPEMESLTQTPLIGQL